MLAISKFDTSKAASTGGVTGSRKVLHIEENHNYQLKSSIRDAKVIRRLKAGGTDRENFGEVIAANIGYAFLGKNKVPEVQLVYDEERKRVLIASRYLDSEGTPPCTLDQHLAEAANLPPTQKHVKIVSKYEDNQPGSIKVTDPAVQELLPSLARSIAISMITGDHDINPGNMMVVYEGVPPKPTVARIDFGHAFNDLLNAPETFGGGVLDKEHPSMDFLNRSAVAGFPTVGESKLWRDYPGLVPSQVLVDAMREILKDSGNHLKVGIDNAKNEFAQVLEQQKLNKDFIGIQHTLTSLQAICKNYTNEDVALPDVHDEAGIQNYMDTVFSHMEGNFQNYLKDIQRTADIMQLQVNIDAMIEFEKANVGNPLEDYTAELSAMELRVEQQYKALDPMNGGIEWIKTDADTPPFKGNLNQYVEQRKPILGELIAKMQQRSEDYTHKVEGQIYASHREGMRKSQTIQKGVFECIRLVDQGRLDEASLAINKLKKEYEDTYGKNNLIGQTSTGYKVVLELEQDLKKAQAEAQKINEENLKGLCP